MKRALLISMVIVASVHGQRSMVIYRSDGTKLVEPVALIDSIKFSSVPLQGLVAYYPFSGNANDLSGNGYNGTVEGATLCADRFSQADRAYSFNGNEGIVVTTDQILSGFGAATVNVWVNFDSFSSNYETAFTTGPSSQFALSGNGPIFAPALRDRVNLTVGISGMGFNAITTDSTLAVGTWHMITGVYDGNALRIYLDGALQDENTSLDFSGNLDTFSGIYFGRSWNASTTEARFHGDLDDIRVYNRALDAGEILSLYEEGGWTGS